MILQAQAYIDGRLMRSAYAIPFADPVPSVISHCTALQTGIMLYSARRIVSDATENQVAAQEKEVENYLSRILADTLLLPLPRKSTIPPKVSSYEDENVGAEYDPAWTAACRIPRS